MVRHADDQGTDAGFSLIEILISIAIMGIAMVAVLGALATQVKGAGLHRDESNAGSVVASAAEQVQAVTYAACTASTSPLASYQTAARQAALPSDWQTKGLNAASAISVTGITYWNGSSFSTSCVVDPTDTAGLLQIQLVSLRAAGPGAGAAETLDVIKRGS